MHLGNWIQHTKNWLHQTKMQKICIWKLDTKYLISIASSFICKNSASDKLETNTSNRLHQATVSVKIVGTLLYLLVPPMLVYTIWWLNRNKQHWKGKGKHTVFALSAPTTAVFLSGMRTVGLSREWLWEAKKRERKKRKKRNKIFKI